MTDTARLIRILWEDADAATKKLGSMLRISLPSLAVAVIAVCFGCWLAIPAVVVGGAILSVTAVALVVPSFVSTVVAMAAFSRTAEAAEKLEAK